MIDTNIITFDSDRRANDAFNVVKAGYATLITGKSCSGKTLLRNKILEHISKKYLILAPNEKEAIKTREVSVESFFKLSKEIFKAPYKFNNDKYSKAQTDFIKDLELIVIDDVSGLSAPILDAMDVILRSIKDPEYPMGGVQLFLVGDLNGIKPCLTKYELSLITKEWKSQYFFDAKCYSSICIIPFELAIDYKHLDFDVADFIGILQHRTLNSELLDYFNILHAKDEIDDNDLSNKTIITVSRKDATKINAKKLAQLDGIKKVFNGELLGIYNIEESPIELNLHLKVGAEIISIDPFNKNFPYGSKGVIIHLNEDNLDIETEGNMIKIKKIDFFNYEYQLNALSSKYVKVPIGKLKQFPLRLGWAISIADSKNMCFDDVYFENKTNITLQVGDVYNAYSRGCGRFDKFRLHNPLKENDILTDEKISRYFWNFIFRPFVSKIDFIDMNNYPILS
jgi:ATP-dependent DNA helicase PIF1